MFNVSMEAETMDDGLPMILHNLLNHGQKLDSRNGKVTELAMARVHFRNPNHNPYSTTPHRRASVKAQIAEVIWILSGRNDIKFIERYLPRAAEFSDDGQTWRGGYGPRLRAWGEGQVDQLYKVAQELTRDPNSRRAVMQIFDPELDFVQTKDVPCNNWLSFIIRDGKLHTHVAVRSNDAFWGLSGINYFEWTIVGQVLAYLVGVEPGSLTFSTTSLHLYEHHWERAGKIAQESLPGSTEPRFREMMAWVGSPAPGGEIPDHFQDRWSLFEEALDQMVQFLELPIEEQRAGRYYYDRQPFALFREWMKAVSIENRSEIRSVPALSEPLTEALIASPWKRVNHEANPEVAKIEEDFTKFVDELHESKNAAYGDSWRRRGEMVGILANIARKVDRLGRPGAGDNELDTRVDLMLYLVKYQLWLQVRAGYATEQLLNGTPHHRSVMTAVNRLAGRSESWRGTTYSDEDLIKAVQEQFETLTKMVEAGAKGKTVSAHVQLMADEAYHMAKHQHRKEVLATKQFTGYDV